MRPKRNPDPNSPIPFEPDTEPPFIVYGLGKRCNYTSEYIVMLHEFMIPHQSVDHWRLYLKTMLRAMLHHVNLQIDTPETNRRFMRNLLFIKNMIPKLEMDQDIRLGLLYTKIMSMCQ
jgi:hypothetical protein